MAEHHSFRLTPASEQARNLSPQSPFLRLCGILAVVGFVISLLVHASTFFGVVPPKMTFLLHFGAIVIFIVAVLDWTRVAMSRRTTRSMAEARRAHAELSRQSIRAVPTWIKVVCVLCFAYTALNFVLLFVNMEGGAPGNEGNHYYLHIHGKKVRDLTADQFHQMEAYEVRGFSGHWMLFYLISAVFFLYVSPTVRMIAFTGQPPNSPLAEE
jgi:hypothetical protein